VILTFDSHAEAADCLVAFERARRVAYLVAHTDGTYSVHCAD